MTSNKLESVGILEQHAEHRSGVRMVQMFRREKLAPPFADILVSRCQIAFVDDGLFRKVENMSEPRADSTLSPAVP